MNQLFAYFFFVINQTTSRLEDDFALDYQLQIAPTRNAVCPPDDRRTVIGFRVYRLPYSVAFSQREVAVGQSFIQDPVQPVIQPDETKERT
jgi:hypothetical protein